MDILSYVHEVNDKVRDIVGGMTYVPAEEIGLDRRAAYRLWISEDCIVVDKTNDKTLQYYGGFEYVDKDCRIELGDYVIYSADDSRVHGHLDSYYNAEEESDPMDDFNYVGSPCHY